MTDISYTLAPTNMRLHNVHSFGGELRPGEHFSVLLGEWLEEAKAAAAKLYPDGFRLASVSHAFIGNSLTAVFLFQACP